VRAYAPEARSRARCSEFLLYVVLYMVTKRESWMVETV